MPTNCHPIDRSSRHASTGFGDEPGRTQVWAAGGEGHKGGSLSVANTGGIAVRLCFIISIWDRCSVVRPDERGSGGHLACDDKR
jgi:hypothetical protein